MNLETDGPSQREMEACYRRLPECERKLKIAREALTKIVDWHIFRWSKAAGIAAEALHEMENGEQDNKKA